MRSEQSSYQVRLGWGRPGLARVALDADVVLWVDVVGPSEVIAWPPEADVVASDLHSAGAVAAWVATRQEQLARRLTIAVIAAGPAEHDGGYAVEDHLGAGAVIAALGALGIDATSPDAAVADAAYRALRPAIGHLVSASTAGRAAGVEPAAYRVGANASAAAPTAAVRVIQPHPMAPDRPGRA